MSALTSGPSVAGIFLCLILAGCAPMAPPLPADTPIPDAAGIARAAALPAPFNAADPVAGREAFALCFACHTLDPAKPPMKGPTLAGVFGAKAASRTDYEDYSDALRSSGIVWDAAHLDRWLFNPHEALPGTSMGFIGIRADKKRRDLIAFLAAVTPAAP